MSKVFLRALVPVAVVACVLSPTPASAQSETIEYYGLDALGSVRAIFDPQGNVVGRMDYGPFGENLRAAIKFPTEQFAQLARDAESGQDYAHARNYSAGSARMNRVDPVYAGLFQPQLWNRYAYSINNPLSYVDRTGMSPESGRLASDFCDAEFSMDDCGGGEMLPSMFGLGFGRAYAGALNLGFNPGMSSTVWQGLLEHTLAVADALSQSSTNSASAGSVTTEITGVRLADGITVANEPFAQLAGNIAATTGPVVPIAGAAVLFTGGATVGMAGAALVGSGEAISLGRIIMTNRGAGQIIGWGSGQTSLGELTAMTQNLTGEAVKQMARRGLTLEHVKELAIKYGNALEAPAKRAGNAILRGRYDLMERIQRLWPRR